MASVDRPRAEGTMSSVLVLDDMQADRELLATVLGNDGHRVAAATTAEEALQRARAEPPDVIITGVFMPAMNGYEFVRRLRADPDIGDTTVVFCTGAAVEGDVRRLAKACGVTRFLPKPPDQATIVSTVRDALAAQNSPTPFSEDEFDRELRVLSNKLAQKVSELEAADSERRTLVAQVLSAQDDERQRIAQDVHDGPIQALAAAMIWLDLLRPDINDSSSTERLRTLRTSVERAVESLRSLVFTLGPLQLGTEGLGVALRICLERAQEDYGVSCMLENRMSREPTETTRKLLFRAARETIANVGKHAEASQIHVLVYIENGHFVLRVHDDGVGFRSEEAMRVRPGHLGLPSLRAQVESAVGSLHVESRPGEGATIEIRLPDIHMKAVDAADPAPAGETAG